MTIKQIKTDAQSDIINSGSTDEVLTTEIESQSGKNEWKRTRRLSMFKRVTSIENLKSHRERQRKYIRKNKTPKFDTTHENEDSQINIKGTTVRLSDSESTATLHYQCNQCSSAYSNQKSLDHHSRSVHNDKYGQSTSIICNICRKGFRTTDSMIRHLHIHKKENTMEVYKLLKEMRMEKKIDNVKTILNDDVNENDEGNIILLKKNIETTDKSLELKSRVKLINTWIREYLDPDNEGKGFSCWLCNKSYVAKKSLVKHQRQQHSRQIETTDNSIENQEIVEQINSYNCEKCQKTFKKEIELQKHMRIHEEDSNFKRYLCHICSKTFRHNAGLMFHMRTHTGYKPHVCKYCSRGFTSKSNCVNHERTHTGDRPFVCHYCSAAFAKSCTLKSHITTHTGEANYHCKTCGKSFRRLKYLKEHKFTHTGEKPYACKICGTAYSHSGSLFVHEKKCKAQLSNYQSTTTPTMQNYGTTKATGNPTSIISAFNSPLAAVSSSKNFIIQPASDSFNINNTVKDIAITGQIFNN